jgi:chromosome segregation ATPase
MRQITQEMQSLDKELEELKPRVRAIGSRYADIVRRVEIAESEYDAARSSVLRLETTYREGKVSRDAYARLREDHYKRMDRAKTLIEGTTISLREEVR